MSAYPDFVARFYNVIYDRLRSSVDHAYYLKQLTSAEGPVLEVGVGTGRLFKDAWSANADIYGVDLSEAMLKIARTQPGIEPHRLISGDIRTMQLGKSFSRIVAPFRVFGHLVSLEDQLIALDVISRHLTKNGTFVFDVFVPDAVLCTKGLEPTLDFDGFWTDGCYLRRTTSVCPDYLNQINHVSMQYEWYENGRDCSGTRDFPMRYFFRYELEHLIGRSPLTLDSLNGDFEGGGLKPGSKEFVVVCRL